MKRQKEKSGQSFLEFSFALIMVVLLMAGMIKVFIWEGNDLVARGQTNDRILMEQIVDSCGTNAACTLRQIRPVFYRPQDIGAEVNSNIFGNPF